MATYSPPIRDMQFVLHEMLDGEAQFTELGYEEASADLVDAVLEEGGRICAEAVFPTNRPGDLEGCSFDDGEVTTPEGYKDAYRVLAEGGWIGLGCDPEYGGQGLPYTVSVLFEEMLQSANVSLALYPGLTHGPTSP